jgi:hypothetical protein
MERAAAKAMKDRGLRVGVERADMMAFSLNEPAHGLRPASLLRRTLRMPRPAKERLRFMQA